MGGMLDRGAGAGRKVRSPRPLPPDPGTYALVLSAASEAAVRVGRLGVLLVRPGFYVYVGSALGPGGLRGRVSRHLRGPARRRWHVDFLRAALLLEEVWFTADAERRECAWSRALRSSAGAAVPLRGCGSSDCAGGCEANLYHFAGRPSRRAFVDRLRRAAPGHGAVRRLHAGTGTPA